MRPSPKSPISPIRTVAGLWGGEGAGVGEVKVGIAAGNRGEKGLKIEQRNKKRRERQSKK